LNFVVEVIPVVSHTFYLLSLSSLQRPWCLKISQIQKLICTFFEYFPIALPYFTREAMMKILPFYMRSNDEDIAVLNEKQWWSYCRVHEKQWWRYCRFTWEAMMKILPFFYSSSTLSLRHKYAQVTFIENPNKRFINFWIKIPGYIIHKWKEYLFKFFNS